MPLLQGLALTSSRAAWDASDAALSPLDATTQVAIPEFDGRLIGVPFSFKELDAGEGGPVPVYVPDPERCARLAGLAVAHGRLRHVPVARRRIALVLSSYPTKHARIGNAVGLDTPASAVVLLDEPAPRGVRRRRRVRRDRRRAWCTRSSPPAGTTPSGSPTSRRRTPWRRCRARRTGAGSAGCPPSLREAMTQAWGEAPGSLYVDESGDEPAIALAALQFGNLVLMIQPPRGFGENPVAIYHDPDMAPSHHYLAAYRWLEAPPSDGGFGAHAVVHLGKHGTLEWLPGKGIGLSAGCAPDAVLGNLPMVYPFIVNDPGEGTQAKRRAHATVVDHLVPPMARAETYGEMARLEQPARRVRHGAGARPRQGARAAPADLDDDPGRAGCTTTCTSTPRPTTTASTTSCCTSTGTSARSRTCRSATGCTCWARDRSASRGSTWCSRCCGRPRCGAAGRRRCPACAAPWRRGPVSTRRCCSPSPAPPSNRLRRSG
nr:cobaltochelatase subunit CobN [Angustibacter aerolatus]